MHICLKHWCGALVSTAGALLIVGAALVNVLKDYGRLPLVIGLFGLLLFLLGGIMVRVLTMMSEWKRRRGKKGTA